MCVGRCIQGICMEKINGFLGYDVCPKTVAISNEIGYDERVIMADIRKGYNGKDSLHI